MLGRNAIRGCALAVVALLGAPAGVHADVDQGSVGGFHFWFSHSDAPAPPNSARAQADCKGSLGEHLIGGGLRINGAISFSSVGGLGPWDDQDGDATENDAYVAFANFSGGGPSGVDAQAACAARETRVAWHRKQTLRRSSSGTFKAACPPGTHASAGGASVYGATDGHHVNSSYPYDDGDGNSKPSDGWAVRVSNGPANRAEVRAKAICTSQTLHYESSTATVPAGSPTIAHTGCGDLTEVAISAGSRLGGPASEARLVSMISEDDGDVGSVPGDQIEFTHQVDGGDPRELERIVICGVPSP